MRLPGPRRFTEQRQGSVSDLASKMLSSGIVTRATASPVSTKHGPFRTFQKVVSRFLGNCWLRCKATPQPGAVTGSLPTIHSGQPVVAAATDYLLVCVKSSRYSTVWAPLDVNGIVSDKQLFDMLRTHFFRKRALLFRAFSLYRLNFITLIQVCKYTELSRSPADLISCSSRFAEIQLLIASFRTSSLHRPPITMASPLDRLVISHP